MKYYFDSEENVDKLRLSLKSWLRTPYAANCHVKGEGVDCGRFVGCVLSECGALDFVSFPFCRRDLVDKINNTILNKLKTIGDLVSDIRDGDVLLFQLGEGLHLGIHCDGNIYHVHKGISVMKCLMGASPWTKRQKGIYRVYG